MRHQIINNSRSLFYLVITAFLIGACATPEQIIAEPEPVAEEKVVVEVAATASPKETITVAGSFRSTKGIQTNLSCYCKNGGILTTSKGEEIMLCFSLHPDFPDCANIRAVGTYQTKSITPEADNPCPAGTVKYLLVDSFKCQEVY